MSDPMSRASFCAKTRPLVAVVGVMSLALLGATQAASAQAGCQPTITQPCAPTPNKAASQTPKRKDSSQSDDANEPKDHSPRIQVDNDTDLKFGTGGIGLGRKF
jgi:hypothetical protein